ncbi:hypothetical protein OIU79_021049 [Salix purpurea]|uniref:Uncharacterized protein n=1 Tax=Salix purpurea TaxID=77065 RepID=A0A9Q1AGK6_SALPP|nr:hypothetical protein OIU79_021049 [Salix purpurea]
MQVVHNCMVGTYLLMTLDGFGRPFAIAHWNNRGCWSSSPTSLDQIVYRPCITLTLLNTVAALLPRFTWKRLQIPNPRFRKLGDEMRGKHKGVETV